MVSALIRRGTLNIGDVVVAGEQMGVVKAMVSFIPKIRKAGFELLLTVR
jgi:hypothetical protein